MRKATKTSMVLGTIAFAMALGIALPNANNAYANAISGESSDEGDIRPPSTGGGITETLERCKTEFGVDGVTFTANGEIVCGTDKAGNWGTTGYYAGAQEVLGVCDERYGINDKVTYLANGDITCGGYRVAAWSDEVDGLGITILPAPVPSTGGSISSPDTSSIETIRKELQDLINAIKNDPLYKLYSKLIEAVKKAEEILANAGVSRAVDVAKFANAGRSGRIVLASTNTSELVSAIKAIGDALRELGVETNLGINITTANTDDLRYAITTAKNTAKYAEYAGLMEVLERAEVALANGAFSEATLAELTAAKAATGQLGHDQATQAPGTGVNITKGLASATTTIAAAAIVSSVIAGVGLVIVKMKR